MAKNSGRLLQHWGEHDFSHLSTAAVVLTHFTHNFFSLSCTIPSGTQCSMIVAFSFDAFSTIG